MDQGFSEIKHAQGHMWLNKSVMFRDLERLLSVQSNADIKRAFTQEGDIENNKCKPNGTYLSVINSQQAPTGQPWDIHCELRGDKMPRHIGTRLYNDLYEC